MELPRAAAERREAQQRQPPRVRHPCRPRPVVVVQAEEPHPQRLVQPLLAVVVQPEEPHLRQAERNGEPPPQPDVVMLLQDLPRTETTR